jgi:cytochrome c oxidase subunit 2
MFEKFRLLPEQASTYAAHYDLLWWAQIAFTIGMSMIVALVIFALLFRYRRRSEDETGEAIHGNTLLEIGWTAVPFGIAVILLVWSVSLFLNYARPPEDALNISVIGKQWMWKLQHPNGRREINELHIPVGRPVRLTLASEDVIHSFFVPAFRVKQDVIPGRYTTLWFEATKIGEYRLFCAEYCGTSHSSMGGRIVVMDPLEYQNWLAGADPEESPVAAGRRLFEQYGCKSCHQSEDLQRGPSLAGVIGSTVQLASGETAIIDDEYLRESILNPRAKIVDGYQDLMPAFRGLVSEESLLQLIAYIKSLSPKETVVTQS